MLYDTFAVLVPILCTETVFLLPALNDLLVSLHTDYQLLQKQ